MSEARPDTAEVAASVAWTELFRGERALYTLLVVLGVALHALQVLVIAIVMPTVVADIGGADFYTWPAMLYTIGAIVGAASVGPVWGALGPRRGYAASGLIFLVGSLGCALAPTMGLLIAARALQGFAGGLITGGGMALIGTLFGEGHRRRLLALNQGVWMIAQLMGPVVGGAFAEIGWWRGSFWTMLPIALGFIVLAWLKLPEGMEEGAAQRRGGAFPFLRLMLLSGGVFAVALAGPVGDGLLRIVMIAGAAVLVGATLRLDRRAGNRLYPSGALSLFSPVGLALWILFLGGMSQTSVNLFMPLLLQVVHGVTPLFVSFIAIVISLGWTIGTFAVSGWTGRGERIALNAGPLLMIAGLAGITATAQLPLLAVLTGAAFVLGLGVGIHHVHLMARTMANAREGEERITAAAMPSIRSLGTAFGAAVAGMLSSIYGLGDATDAAAVGRAVTFVYGYHLVPLVLAAACMFVLVARHARRG